MEKENVEDGEYYLPPEINRVKEQIEKERYLQINETFELRCKPSVAAHASHHHSLAFIRSCAEDNSNNNSYRIDNNMLLSRMQTPLRHFIGSSYNSESDEVCNNEIETLPSVKLPFVEQLPPSITWVFTNRSLLMDESDSVIGKRQIYYKDGEAVELLTSEEEDDDDEDQEKEEEQEGDDDEEEEREKCIFTEQVDRFIWTIGQEYGLDDPVVQSALTNFLKVDVSNILERYAELKLKNDGNAGEASNLRSKRILSTFQEAAKKRFCRRCVMFDCRMHEDYQPAIKSREYKSNFSDNEDDDKIQCSEHCYLKVRSVTETDDHLVDYDNSTSNNKGKNVVSDTYTEPGECSMNDTEMSIWTPVEKDLYLKGVHIFGRNSCLITHNIFREHKTCLEVYSYMLEQDRCTLLLEYNQTPTTHQVNKKIPRRNTKLSRKKIRLRKYARCPPALKKTANGDDKAYKLYTPCTCEPMCGDQCPCLASENCCEKYCGCSKKCYNRFLGCNCAKGQCMNRQCPCFAANRECDPDLCRSCKLSCGDCSLIETSEQSQCKNMQFLLKKHKKILLAKSDVQGWGAFTRHSLRKNEFLGEYTGELITHDEADERGRVEELIGSSYLFDLNDQHEVDARRKGNKFRCLNHSSKPNCYAKFVVVRGDQRIGLYASRDINEGEELFFNYGYNDDQAEWSRSRKPRKTGGSRKPRNTGGPDQPASSRGRKPRKTGESKKPKDDDGPST